MAGFRVARKRCNECLFSSARIVDEERAAEVLAECARTDRHFICHKFTIAAMEAGEDPADANGIGNTCCRAFYDRDPAATNLMRIAGRLGVVRFVELPKTEDRK